MGPMDDPGSTAWSVGALLRAQELGWSGLEPAIERVSAPLARGSRAALSGDRLSERAFWELALGPTVPRPGQAVDDLFAASVAVLAAR